MSDKQLAFKLNNWQSQVARNQSRFMVLNCGRRAGKSTLSALKLITFAQKNPKAILYYVSPSYKQSKAIMWELLKEYLPKSWITKANDTELKIELFNSSRIELKGADTEPDRLRGVRIDFLVCDEVAAFRNWYTVWNKVLRPTLIDSKGSAWFISTPQGFNFWYDLYNTVDPDFTSYTFTTYDNEFIDPSEIEKLKQEALSKGTMDTFEQEIMAKFTQVAGVVYKEWNFINKFRPVHYDYNLPLHLTFDFGVNDPTAIIWIQRQGGEFRAIDFYEASDANVEHFIQVIQSKPYKTPELITGDPAGKARSIVSNTSPIDEYAKHGIHIRTKDGVTIPEQIRIAHKYMTSFYVDNSLQTLRDHIHNYRYPVKQENVVNQSNEIPIHDEHSHSMRALEYYFVNIDEGIDTFASPQINLIRSSNTQKRKSWGIS